MFKLEDTIIALATPQGIGALAVIRVSGAEAISITSRFFKGKDLATALPNTIHYGHIQQDNRIIDEVMLSVFKAPKSFTTEDSVEISCHGSPFIVKEIIGLYTRNGVRLATPGEFTLRAYLHGRIDLSQAESIADLIAAENEASRRHALKQLKGGVSMQIADLRGQLLHFLSLIELELDFSEEDVAFADRKALSTLVQTLEIKIKTLIESFAYGNAIKNGINVAIVGKPNTGKSTLLNTLIEEERAIVSDIAGTTRDAIEEVIHIKGNAFRFIDTAGIRDTDNQIEAIGVQRAKEKINTADILLYTVDATSICVEEIVRFVEIHHKKGLYTLLLLNKIDLVEEGALYNQTKKQLGVKLKSRDISSIIYISAKNNQGIDHLKTALTGYVDRLKTTENNTVITNQRHLDALQNALIAIQQVQGDIKEHAYTELMAFDIRHALEHLGQISGEFTNDEVLEHIFGKFCIGK